MHPSIRELEDFLDSVLSETRGPGGAIAIVKDAELLTRRVWGYANLSSRIRMTERVQMPICSISKQMLVLVLMSMIRKSGNEPRSKHSLQQELRKILPHLFEGSQEGESRVSIEDLFNMQSGIRDYWAMTVLWGATAEQSFSIVDHAPKALDRTRSFHFSPGSEHTYSNVNFHVLGRALEAVFGHSLGQLLSQEVFIPAKMKTAALCPNTDGFPSPIMGYEGTEKSGYVEATNRIEWEGDAGIIASLDDMIAYEKYLQRSWHDENSLYRAIAPSATFKDGNWATYSHGLMHFYIGTNEMIGHTGGLRGFRMARFHVPSAGFSVIVMHNHEVAAGSLAQRVLKFMLGVKDEESAGRVQATSAWEGSFFDDVQQRVISVKFSEKKDEVMINYSGAPTPAKLKTAETAATPVMKARIEGDSLHIELPGDNAKLVAHRVPAPVTRPTSDFGGEYYCEEVDSTFSCNDSHAPSGVVYGAFTGFLGQGPAHLMRHIGGDIWVLICPRTMDAPAPGEWTIIFRRDIDSKVVGATVGCWLARKLDFVRKA